MYDSDVEKTGADCLCQHSELKLKERKQLKKKADENEMDGCQIDKSIRQNSSEPEKRSKFIIIINWWQNKEINFQKDLKLLHSNQKTLFTINKVFITNLNTIKVVFK